MLYKLKRFITKCMDDFGHLLRSPLKPHAWEPFGYIPHYEEHPESLDSILTSDGRCVQKGKLSTIHLPGTQASENIVPTSSAMLIKRSEVPELTV